MARLGVPTLIVWGAQDRFASPKVAQRFHDEIPGFELAVLDQAGHFVWEDAPPGRGSCLSGSWGGGWLAGKPRDASSTIGSRAGLTPALTPRDVRVRIRQCS